MKMWWRKGKDLPQNCRYCGKLHSRYCPIRAWGRNEANNGKNLDVDPNFDYCSRFIVDLPVERR